MSATRCAASASLISSGCARSAGSLYSSNLRTNDYVGESQSRSFTARCQRSGRHPGMRVLHSWEVAAVHKGLIPHTESNPDMRLGKLLERGLVEFYAEITTHPVRFIDESVLHPDWPWLRYTIDAIDDAVPAVIEAKMVNEFMSREWGDCAEEMPLRVQVQTQLYMAATRLPVCHVIALLKGTPRIFVQEFDPDAANTLCDIMEQFWRRYIIGDEMPPLDTSEAAGRYLQQLYPHHRPKDIVDATPEQAEILDDYLTLRVTQRTIVEARARLEVRLKQEVADHEGLRWHDGVFTWRKTKDGKVTNWEALALGLLHGYVTDPEERKKMVEFYTRPKPGSRRVWLASDQLKEAAEVEA